MTLIAKFVINEERNTEGSSHYADFALGKHTQLTQISHLWVKVAKNRVNRNQVILKLVIAL